MAGEIFNLSGFNVLGFHSGPLQKESSFNFNEKALLNTLNAVSWVPVVGGLISGPLKIFIGIHALCYEKYHPSYSIALIARGVVELIPGSCLIIIPLDIVFSIGRCFCSEEITY